MKDRDISRQNTEPQTKRMMWFRGQYVPILYSSDRASFFGSKHWVARGTIQRIGAAMFATVFFCGAIALFIASKLVRIEIVQTTEGVLGQIFGVVFAILAVLVGCFAMILSFRLARGVIRSIRK